MAVLSGVLSLTIGAIFASSFTAKAFDYAGFRRILQYTLRIGSTRAQTLGIMVLAAEAAVALAGFAQASWRALAYLDLGLAAFLLLAFTGWALMMAAPQWGTSCPTRRRRAVEP